MLVQLISICIRDGIILILARWIQILSCPYFCILYFAFCILHSVFAFLIWSFSSWPVESRYKVFPYFEFCILYTIIRILASLIYLKSFSVFLYLVFCILDGIILILARWIQVLSCPYFWFCILHSVFAFLIWSFSSWPVESRYKVFPYLCILNFAYSIQSFASWPV